MGIDDRDADRSRKRDAKPQERRDEGAEADVGQQHMRLLAMRRRQVQRKAERRSQAGARIPEGGGTPLGRDVRTRFEGELGADLSGVTWKTVDSRLTIAPERD